MKKVLKIVGMILGGLLGIILCIAAWVAFTGVPTYEPKSIAVQIPTDSAALHVGKVIVEERCAFCHYGADGKLSGRQFTSADEPFGEFWSKNILMSYRRIIFIHVRQYIHLHIRDYRIYGRVQRLKGLGRNLHIKRVGAFGSSLRFIPNYIINI